MTRTSRPGAADVMLAAARRRAILDVITRRGGVRVVEAAREFGVTPETIRRDLDHLERGGRLLRSHGGAVSVDGDQIDLPLDVRETLRLAQKRAIAAVAAQGMREGSVLALDASSTVRELARLLPDMPMTVVTNSAAVAMTLHDRTRIRVVVTGGVLDGPSRSFVGESALQMLDRFHFSRAFISCQGLHVERGLSDMVGEQAGIKRRMIALADETVLLADSTKFGAKAVEFFATLADVDTIITDAGPDRATAAAIAKAGPRIVVAGDAPRRRVRAPA